jgi:hypothetical protein
MAIGRVIFFLSGPIPRKGQKASDDCQKGMVFFRPGIDPSNYINSKITYFSLFVLTAQMIFFD